MGSVGDEVGRDRERAQFEKSASRLLHDPAIRRVHDDMVTDQDARDLARDALNKVQSLERLWDERWENQAAATIRIESAVGAIQTAVNKRIGQVPATIISLLMAALGFLAARAFPIH